MTNKNIIPVPPILTNKSNQRLRRGPIPPGADPVRGLIAAIINQAFLDHFHPHNKIKPEEQESAHAFLLSDDCYKFLDWLGISNARIQTTLKGGSTK